MVNTEIREYSVGPHRILLPREHRLDQYQATWKKYDIALGEITRIASIKYPDMAAIDIGANIGDSAALICKYSDIPVLCIEGNRNFLGLLRENVARIGKQIEIEACFIGDDLLRISSGAINENLGTASILQAISKKQGVGSSVRMKSLRTILSSHELFSSSRLLKTDTDGFDFFIIQNSMDMIAETKPVLFIEYDTSFSADGENESISAMGALADAGYKKVIIYDNYGNYLLSTDFSVERFLDLNTYLRSNRRNGIAVYYFDICAFPEAESDLFEEVRRYELTS